MTKISETKWIFSIYLNHVNRFIHIDLHSLTFPADCWHLLITNTGFIWNRKSLLAANGNCILFHPLLARQLPKQWKCRRKSRSCQLRGRWRLLRCSWLQFIENWSETTDKTVKNWTYVHLATSHGPSESGGLSLFQNLNIPLFLVNLIFFNLLLLLLLLDKFATDNWQAAKGGQWSFVGTNWNSLIVAKGWSRKMHWIGID